MRWRSGEFARDRAHARLRPFVPVRAADSLHEVDAVSLWDAGKRLVLLDVDNTIVQWKSHDLAPEIREWIEGARGLGFQMCIISNTKRPDRLMKLSEAIGIPVVRGRFKPSRHMFRMAVEKFGLEPSQAVMIGDQIMTDVWGANRAGVDAIWVKRMEGHEFRGTAVNRRIERWLTGPLYKLLAEPEEGPAAEPGTKTRKQLIRFVVVGASSFVVDYAIRKLLMDFTPFGDRVGRALLGTGGVFWTDDPHRAGFPVAGSIAAVVATFNSFVWNRMWTFEAEGKDGYWTQLVRFFLVAGGGALIGLLVSSTVYALLPFRSVLLATMVGAACGAVWNFLVQRAWTFRAASPG